MTSQYPDIWGNDLMELFTVEKHMEEMGNWLSQGISNFEDMTSMIGKFPGVEFWSSNMTAMDQWEKAATDMQQSFTEYFRLMGIVPINEHLDLVEKYEKLKKKGAGSQDTDKAQSQISEQKKLISDQKKEISKQKKMLADQKKEINEQNKIIKNLEDQISQQAQPKASK